MVDSRPLDFDDYQECANRTSRYKDYIFVRGAEGETRALVSALGLAGEAGEVCDLLKKVVGHGHPINLDAFCDELGDVLWYISDLCSAFGLTLQDVVQHNIEKLGRRYPSGRFTISDSLNRTPAVVHQP